MTLNPYLAFNGTCEKAFNFYKDVLGGEIEMLNRFSEAPAEMGMPIPEEKKNWVMHLTFKFNDLTLQGSDSFEEVQAGNASLVLAPDSVEETDRIFKGLSEGGTIVMPLADTFWGARFGMFTDKFGIKWMLNFTLTNQGKSSI